MHYFVISDIHGHLDKLNKLLKYWNPDKEQLVLIGDYIDRGPEPFRVLKRVKELTERYGAIATLGNHEDMFLSWLSDEDDEEQDPYMNGTGFTTILSFLAETDTLSSLKTPTVFLPSYVRKLIKENHGELISFIENLPLYHDTTDYLFVHAGINPALSNWKNNTIIDLLWIREQFLYFKHDINKIVVFGHTNTYLLHNDPHNTNVWVDRFESKIGIDGGAGSGKDLNGVVLGGKNSYFPAMVYQA